MLSKKIEELLNAQIKIEMRASYMYLAMASWAHQEGFEGIASFLYKHSDEERAHMLKIVKYVNDRDGKAVIPSIDNDFKKYSEFNGLFNDLYEQEVFVSKKIYELVELSLQEKDYSTHNFIQWYVNEQMEEESLAKTILDKMKIIGSDRAGLYLFDRDISNIHNRG